MTIRFFVQHRVAKNRLSTGWLVEAEARDHAVWLAETYGGVSKVTTNQLDGPVSRYSVRRGWH